MHFDADALRESEEEPTLTVGGFVYRGRLLSAVEWLPFYERGLELDAKYPNDLRRRLRWFEDFLRAVFPRRRFRWWAPDPVTALIKEGGPRGLQETFTHFFTLQGRALMPPSPSPTSGTSSPPSTVEPAAEGAP